MRTRKSIPEELQNDVLVSSRRRCLFCFQSGDAEPKTGDIAHIVPLTEKGTHSYDNLVFLCTKHHRELQDKYTSGALSPKEVKAARDSLYDVIRSGSKELHAYAPRVLVIHGHSDLGKTQVKDLLIHLGLEPILIGEQLNLGLSITEKIEYYINIEYAIAILDVDDDSLESSIADKSIGKINPNVLYELGLVVGRLGMQKVSLLVRPNIKLPSDLRGIMYMEMDNLGIWRESLTQELRDAGLPIKEHREPVDSKEKQLSTHGYKKDIKRKAVKAKRTEDQPSGSLLTEREVSQLLHIHSNTIRRWSDQGIIKVYRMSPRGDRRFKAEELALLLMEATNDVADHPSGSLLTEREVSQLLHIHSNTIRRWSDQGIIKAYRIGPHGARRFRARDLALLLRDKINDIQASIEALEVK